MGESGRESANDRPRVGHWPATDAMRLLVMLPASLLDQHSRVPARALWREVLTGRMSGPYRDRRAVVMLGPEMCPVTGGWGGTRVTHLRHLARLLLNLMLRAESAAAEAPRPISE